MDFYKSCLHGEHKCNNHAKYKSDKRFVERKFNQTILNQIGLDYLLAKIWINNEV